MVTSNGGFDRERESEQCVQIDNNFVSKTGSFTFKYEICNICRTTTIWMDVSGNLWKGSESLSRWVDFMARFGLLSGTVPIYIMLF